MRPKTPLTSRPDSTRQLLAFAAEMRSAYLLTDADFEWKTDWDLDVFVTDIVSGTVTLSSIDIVAATYMHVGRIVHYVVDVVCNVVLGGAAGGSRGFGFRCPPVQPKLFRPGGLICAGSGRVRACQFPYLVPPQLGLSMGTVRHFSADSIVPYDTLRIITPAGAVTTTSTLGGFTAEGFYATDILPTRAN